MGKTKIIITNKKRRTRKSKSRRGSRRRRGGLMNLSLSVLPAIRYAKHRYGESTQLFVNNAFSDQIKFSLNGMYDPNISGVGHQPYLFDEMNALYNKYTVLGCKVTVVLRPGSTSNTYAMNVFGETSQLTSIQYPFSLGLEKPGVKRLMFNASSSNVYVPQKVMTFYWSAKKEFRAKDRTELLSNNDYEGTSSTNPNTQAYLYLTYQAQQNQQTTAKLACDVLIDYIVVWHDPKQPGQS